MSTERMTAEQEAEVRRWAEGDLGQLMPYAMFVHELLRELDAVRQERQTALAEVARLTDDILTLERLRSAVRQEWDTRVQRVIDQASELRHEVAKLKDDILTLQQALSLEIGR